MKIRAGKSGLDCGGERGLGAAVAGSLHVALRSVCFQAAIGSMTFSPKRTFGQERKIFRQVAALMVASQQEYQVRVIDFQRV
jgi:hypothetical protein